MMIPFYFSKKYILLFLSLFCFSTSVFAQVFSNKEVGKKNEEKRDSLKQAEYPYVLPIWGKKATQAGFTLPYSAGLSVNYLWQKSDVVINNLKVGFNGGEMYNLDDLIKFNNAVAVSNALNFRPDFWLFPFLNVYGIFAILESSTEVDFTVNVPDGISTAEVINLSTKADFSGTSAGFGITPTIGVGGGWIAFDMNFVWTDLDVLAQPAFSFVFGPRMGKTFYFGKKESNLALWIGGFRLKINTGTEGSLPLNDLLPEDFERSGRIDNAYQQLEEAQGRLDAWWESLSPEQQRLRQGAYDSANEKLQRAGTVVNELESAVNRAGDSTIEYSLDKKPADMWNFLIGTQYQLNRHWMFRAEYGFLTSRKQFIGGIQYRFGL